MENMFNGCELLASLDLSSFDTRNVINLSGMFSSAFSLKSLNLSNFVTKKVEKMDYLFNKNIKLKTLDIRNFYTFNVDIKNKFFNGISYTGTVYLKTDIISNAILKQLPKGWKIIDV